MRKVIIFNSHPVQYFAPLYRYLAKSHDIEVLYLSKHGITPSYDAEFGTTFQWDIPLLEGYKYRFLKNHSLFPKIPFIGSVHLGIFLYLLKAPKKSIIWIHGWQYFTHILAIIIGKTLGHTVCIRTETPLKHELLRKDLKRRKIILKGLFSMVDYFLYIGIQNKKFYKYYKIKEKQLISMPYCVDNNAFINYYQDNKLKKEEKKKSLNIPNNLKIIICVGKLIPKKRPIDVLKAFEELDHSSHCLIFVGEGQLRKEIEEYCNGNKIQNVFITGFVNQTQIVDYYLIADLYVMASEIGETWGLATNEAMCFNLPIIVSDLVGCSDDLIKPHSGLEYQCKDVKTLTKSIKHLLNSSEGEIKSQSIIINYSFESIKKSLDFLCNV